MIEDVYGGRRYTNDPCPYCTSLVCMVDKCDWVEAIKQTKEMELRAMENKWEVGKEYRDNNGNVAVITYVGKPGNHPIQGFMKATGEASSWTASGKSGGSSYRDLTTTEYKEPTYSWVNVYPNSLGVQHTSKEAADSYKCSSRTGRIKINIDEVQGRWD